MQLPAHSSKISNGFFFFSIIIAILVRDSFAIRVAPGSPCESVCGDATVTNGSDIVCNDADFANTATGQAFQNCIQCELNSTYFDSASLQTDLQWLLYNLRWELSWCVWAFPNATGVGTTPCSTTFSCGFYKDNIEWDNLSSTALEYDYCTGFSTQEGTVSDCESCLRDTNEAVFLANFFTVLEAGCVQQPFSGKALTLSGPLFSTSAIEIVNASSLTATLNSHHSGLDLGAKVGIVVGGIVFILIATGCFIVCRGKRRRRKFLAQQNLRNKNMMEAHAEASGIVIPGMNGHVNGNGGVMHMGNGMERRNTPSPPQMPAPLQTRNFSWQRPDKYPSTSPDDGSANGGMGEKYFPFYNSPISGSVSGSTDGAGSAVTMNMVHPWVAGGLGGEKEDGKGMVMGQPVQRMDVVRESESSSSEDIELQRIEPRGGRVDMEFIREAGKHGFTTSPVVESHRDAVT